MAIPSSAVPGAARLRESCPIPPARPGIGRIGATVALVLLIAAGRGAGLGAAAEVRFHRLLSIPGEERLADGSRHPLAELSGVAWLGEDRYAAVMDGDDRLLLFELIVDADAFSAGHAGARPDDDPVDTAPGDALVPATIRGLRTISIGAQRDWEDVALLAAGDGSTTLALVEEDTPAIREFRLAPTRGEGAGRLVPGAVIPLGGAFPGARSNRGPESLSRSPDSTDLWTANEEPLERDGPVPADGVRGRIRLVRLPRGDAGAGRRRAFVYEVEPPHARIGLGTGAVYSGVVALVALPRGRLLVLERSAAVGVPPFENRIFLVDTEAPDVAEAADPVGAEGRLAALPKTRLWSGSLGVNLEGLCLGPPLPDGRRLLIGVADNGAADAPRGAGAGPVNQLALFTWEDLPRDEAPDGPGLTNP